MLPCASTARWSHGSIRRGVPARSNLCSKSDADYQLGQFARAAPPIGVLAYLGLARANAAQANTSNAKAAYQDFLTRWKDVDADIPIYKQAQAGYGELQ